LGGGLAVMTGMVVPLLAGALLVMVIPSGWVFGAKTIGLLKHGLNRRALELGGIVFGAFGMLLLGFWDDRVELKPGVKLLGQFLIATVVAASGVRITLFIPSLLFHYLITVLWIVTLVNALNFMDNMNGLCAGLGAIGAWCFGLKAASDGDYLVATIAFLVAGSLAGFLPWNFPNGKVFLGDAGSHLVGYLLAVLAILPHFYTRQHPNVLNVLIPLLVLAVPLADLVSVVILRWRKGQPFWVGDTNHLSHRLVRAGLSRTGAVITIWFMAAITGALAFL
jgi:UDP-GlcNAc:undecaprenyl-phosphate GlcNAc-1-phosphate transferase